MSAIAPVPVEKVPVPEIAKLPEVWEYPVILVSAPALVSHETPAVWRSPLLRLRFATCPVVELVSVNDVVDAP